MNRLLIAHIRTLLPGLRNLLEDSLDRRSTELTALGEAPPTNAPSARAALLLQLLDGYATRFIEMLDGRSEALPVSELAGGARIRHIFQEIFVRGLEELDPARWVGGGLAGRVLGVYGSVQLWLAGAVCVFPWCGGMSSARVLAW